MGVFLDANFLFSSAPERTPGQASFDLLWELAEGMKVIRLLTGTYCVLEAGRNLRLIRPAALPLLRRRLAAVRIMDGVAPPPDRARKVSPEDDLPVLGAALASKADILLTGNTRDFGPLIDRSDLPLRTTTLRTFLRGGPPRPNTGPPQRDV